MNPEEYIARLQKFQSLLVADLPRFTAEKAMDANALVQNRIINRGLNADEVQLGFYTSEPYKKKREKHGRQTEFVDLTFTRGGAGMFGSTSLIFSEYQNGIARAVVGGKDEFTQKKLQWNSDRYGDVLAMSAKEIELIDASYEEWLGGLIKEAGL